MKIKCLHYLTVLSVAALASPLAASARGNSHSVEFSDSVKVGSTQLTPGNYKLEWQGAGSVVQVSFEQNGKTLVTIPATLKTADNQVTQDAVMIDKANSDVSTLKEIDFGRQKESLVFDQN